MVTRPYHSDEEHSLRRYSSRGNSTWHISHDRFTSSDSVNRRPSARDFQLSSQDSRNGDHDSDGESTNQPPRRRIAVACGRCRKRKIRCSGDPGNGTGCSNCKQAGNTQCQFLRVQSDECHYLSPGDSLTTYQPTAARSVQCVVPSVNFYRQPTTTYSQVPAINAPIESSYRTNSIPNYQYPPKQLFTNIPWGSEYSDESIEYNSSSTPYPLLNQEPLNIHNYTHNGSRNWNTPHKDSSSIFVDQDTSSYTHNTVPYNHSMMYRSSINTDSPFSLSNMASSLPNASPISDRMLPNPATGRSSLNYGRSDSYPEGPLRTLSTNISMPTSMAPPININNNSSNNNGVTQCSGSYLPLSSSPDSNPSSSSQLSYSHTVPSTSSELYPNDSLYGSDSLRHQDSSNYLYSDDTSTRKDSLGRNSLSGTLASGQVYNRIPSDASQTYATRRASMDLPAQNTGAPLRAN